MRILMVTDFYAPFVGGVEVMVGGLARELALRGHSVSVATLAVSGLPAAEVDGAVHVYRIRTAAQRVGALYAATARPWAPPAPDPEAVAGLHAIVRRERPDVVHGHDWLARSYLPLKRRRGPAFAMSLHYFTLRCPKKNLMYDGRPCNGPALLKCLGCAGRHYGRAKGALVVSAQFAFSRAEAALVDLFLPVSSATATGNGLVDGGLSYEVVPNFVAGPAEHGGEDDLLRLLPDEPFLLFVGDLRRDKGVHVLLDAYARLRDAPGLVLIGEVWPETPQQLPPGVRLLENWPNAAVRSAMRRCLALVTPSIWPEPFGMVVIEAMAAGRPVVASAIGGIPELARDGREGLLVPPDDAAALARALDTVVRDVELRERLAANASRRAARFSPEAVVPRFEAVYQRLLTR
jgi:glycosyltransferase involved in cell wall biosynthesis